MTAVHTVAINCDLVLSRRCVKSTGPKPRQVTELRRVAAAEGWEVMRGNHGRDVCPVCRIDEIKSQAQMAEAIEGTAPTPDTIENRGSGRTHVAPSTPVR